MGAAEVDAEPRERAGLVDDPVREVDDRLSLGGRLGAGVEERDEVDEEGVIAVAAGNSPASLSFASERSDLDD